MTRERIQLVVQGAGYYIALNYPEKVYGPGTNGQPISLDTNEVPAESK
jgi:hypothetical protein